MSPKTGFSCWIDSTGGYVTDLPTLEQVARYVANAFRNDKRAEVRAATGRPGGRTLNAAETDELLELTTEIILGRRTA